jgi:hypothetical protein
LEQDEQRQFEAARRTLQAQHADVPASVVDALFAEVVADFSDAPVRAFVPLLTQRRVSRELRERTHG